MRVACLHLQVKGVSCEVCHVVEEPVVLQDDERAARLAKVRVLDVYGPSCSADVPLEDVVGEDSRALVAFDHDRCDIFELVDDDRIVKLCIRINHGLEEVVGVPQIVNALLELHPVAIIV